MSLPARFLEELRERVPLAQLIGRKVKLVRKGREFSGLCPFHNEKTPSFTVNEEKGFYHCFGCGAHGDVIRFLTDAEKMSFMEAVEYLANLAGMKMPQLSPADLEQEKKRTTLLDIVELSCQFFQSQLMGLGGAAARDYLKRRGISKEIAVRFRLGYAPGSAALTAHLQSKGIPLPDCVALGLSVKKDARAYDYFYERLMFPILNRRGQPVAFGGRLLEKGEPKYLNSPETELFRKGEQLYALSQALPAIRTQNAAVLVEGYMDVIALHSAGFANAVAPLGTALTERQLALLWQACDEPAICFDGDAAGQKAAARALNRALPLLAPGKSLQFVFLPAGFDPDDMIRKKSPEAFRQALQEAASLGNTLWRMLLETHRTDTPEQLAKLEADTRKLIGGIQDASVRAYYAREFKDRMWQLTRAKGGSGRKKGARAPTNMPLPGVAQAKMLAAYLIAYPHAGLSFLEEITEIKPPDRQLLELLQKITAALLQNPAADTEGLLSALSPEEKAVLTDELEMLQKSDRLPQEISAELEKMLADAKIPLIRLEIEQKVAAYTQTPTPELWEKIKILQKELEKLTESE